MTSEVVSKFIVQNPFENLKTIEQSVRLVKKHLKFVEPVTKYLDDRTEHARNVEGEYTPRQVKDSFHYIPILQVIELISSNDGIRELVMSECDAAEGFMEKYRDGENFKKHPFFSVNNSGIQLQIYYDDLEVVNALGSRTIIHKLGAFYFRILNLPHYLNSSLGGIQLFLLSYSSDLKKYSFRRILQPFLEDLRQLENGVPMNFKGKEISICGTLAAVCSDGLAIHDLFGLLSPACKFFCRECGISREDLLAGNIVCEEYRNRQEYAERLQRVKDNPDSKEVKTATGLNEECALHESQYWHATENHIFDPTHDFLEGTVPYEVKLVVRQHIVVEKLYDVEFLNNRIHSFAYDVTEIRNKPSANITLENVRAAYKDHSLRQMASQMMLLVRVLPFLLSDVVPEDDPHMKLILLLLDIISIVFAPKLHRGTLPVLEEKIREHDNLFKILFPEGNFLNKHHHINHYRRFIEKMGPAVHHSCIRFEAKHHDLVRHGAVCCSFRNIPKTLARVCQFSQAKHWGDPEISPWEKIHVTGGKR